MKDLILTLEMVEYLRIARDTLNKIGHIHEDNIKDLCLGLDDFKSELLTKNRRCRE